MRAEAYQVVDAALLTFDNRQIATRSDFNVGSEVSLYPFIPGWDFAYEVTVRATRGAWPEPPPRERAVEAQRTRSERRPGRPE